MTDDKDDDATADSGPNWERLNEQNRVSDAEWSGLIDSWNAPTAVNSEIPSDVVAEHLEQDDDWERPSPPMVGWRSAPPMFILALIAAVGGTAALILGAIMIRPLPGWLVLILIVAILAGGAYLFRQLPNERHTDGDDGASV